MVPRSRWQYYIHSLPHAGPPHSSVTVASRPLSIQHASFESISCLIVTIRQQLLGHHKLGFSKCNMFESLIQGLNHPFILKCTIPV